MQLWSFRGILLDLSMEELFAALAMQAVHVTLSREREREREKSNSRTFGAAASAGSRLYSEV